MTSFDPTRRCFLGAAAMLSALPALEGDSTDETQTDGAADGRLARTADELVYTSQRAEVEGDEEILEEAEQLYAELGKRLGEIRVGVLGELEDLGGQRYNPIDLRPGGLWIDSDFAKTHVEREDLNHADVYGQIIADAMILHFGQENEEDVYETSLRLTPDQCREIAELLYQMAADAEHSAEVDINGGGADTA